MWHRPRFYSNTDTVFYATDAVKPFWNDLYAAGADLILNAHSRDYERFAPQTPDGAADSARGIREIIIGTGGEGLDEPNTNRIANSEVNISQVYGVLQLTLADGSYTWRFVPVAGQTATDTGTTACIGRRRPRRRRRPTSPRSPSRAVLIPDWTRSGSTAAARPIRTATCRSRTCGASETVRRTPGRRRCTCTGPRAATL